MMTAPIITATDLRFSTTTAAQSARNLDTLLVALITFIRRFVVVTDAQAVAIVLWVAHTHTFDAFDCTPYLQITSATKRAGKTRLLEVLEPIVARPWFTGRTSTAALMRKVDAEMPTLLLDESDRAFTGDPDYAAALIGQLNAGYRRSGKHTVCFGQGANIHAKDFRTFCPKAIAGIGELPGTIADRAIRIELRRRTTDEPCERWRERDGHEQATPLHTQLAAWAGMAVEILRDARPLLPSSLGDRQADVWEPLFSIGDLAGGPWPTQARHAAITLAETVEDQDIVVELLSDVAAILADYPTSIIATKELLEKLIEQDDRPWATWTKGKPLTAHKLARLLRPLGIHVVHVMRGNGYRVDAFSEACARYLPSKASYLHSPNKAGAQSQILKLQPTQTPEGSETAKTPIKTGTHEAMKLQSRDPRLDWIPAGSGDGTDGKF